MTPRNEPFANHDDLAEVLADLGSVSARLRAALPVIVTVAGADDAWPDTVLSEVILGVAESIGRLEAAAGLVAPEIQGEA